METLEEKKARFAKQAGFETWSDLADSMTHTEFVSLSAYLGHLWAKEFVSFHTGGKYHKRSTRPNTPPPAPSPVRRDDNRT